MKTTLWKSVCLFGLCAGAARGQNLLVNGGFESGSAGWSTYHASWGGNDGQVNFNSTEPGRVGASALHLSLAPGTDDSFAVYQQVAVTPGRAYRIDAAWKANHYGQNSWYEIMLIDGPWDPVQADTGGSLVLNNHMFAYDTNASANCPGGNPITASFPWTWTHDQYDQNVDNCWNNRDGVRVATGNTMTVVLKAGSCCGTNRADVWFDEVSLTALTVPGGSCSVANGDFSAGLAGWTPWIQHDDNADFSAAVVGGELGVSGSDCNGGVYQQIDTAGPGTVVDVIGRWRSDPTLANAMWAEVLVINADRVPVNGVDETDGVNDAVLLYRNDTFGGRGAWNGVMPQTAPVKYQVSFVAAGYKATIVLKAGNTGPSTPTGVFFDDLQVRCVPAPATLAALPSGFALRSYTFPVSHMVSMAQSPVSRLIYALRNDTAAASTQLYRVNIDGPSISSTQITSLGTITDNVQGVAFDPAGNMYISNQYGRIVRGIDTNPDPNVDSFSFSVILDLPDPQIGTFHGVGGVAVGPDNKLYINSGSETHYGPETDKGFNMRILRCNLDGTGVETFCEGIRNSFDISFRADGKLFGVENGPLLNCDYAEEFNLLEQGFHYGFPYKFGSDISGSDSSVACTSDPGKTGPQPLPGGLTPRPAWANYGPDSRPGPGQRGYSDGGIYYGFHPHSSPDGLDFYEPELMDGSAIKFPSEFHGRAFVGRFGQLENTAKVGFDVVSLRLDEPNEGFFCNTFLTGMRRAIDVLCAYNGRLYILEFNQDTDYDPTFGNWNTLSRIHEISYTIPPDQPLIQVSTPAINRTADFGQGLSDDTFTVWNGGSGTLSVTVDDDAAWLSVSPAGGTSTGPGDAALFTVSYSVAGLAVGTHNALITVSDPAASNDPRTIAVSVQVRTVLPDFDGDGDVDLTDFAHLQLCFSGAGVAPQPGCEDARMDADPDVDAGDFNLFQLCLQGANLAADPACDDNF